MTEKCEKKCEVEQTPHFRAIPNCKIQLCLNGLLQIVVASIILFFVLFFIVHLVIPIVPHFVKVIVRIKQ